MWLAVWSLCYSVLFLFIYLCWTVSPLSYFWILKPMLWPPTTQLESSVARSQSCFPNVILVIPDYLRRWHSDISHIKRCRRCGKHRGVSVKLKMELHTGHVSSFFPMMLNLGGGRCVVWRSLDLPARWLRPLLPDSPVELIFRIIALWTEPLLLSSLYHLPGRLWLMLGRWSIRGFY